METLLPRKVHYTKPSITSLEIEYVQDAITNGWGTHCYDYINRFQDAFKNYIESPFALATSSCTGALHLTLAAMGVGAGDEVIVPESTWVASASPINYVGATPVFVDIDPETWCISPESILKNITPRTKAIVVVHLYGNVADMDSIMKIAQLHNLWVIEDAAQALGSIHNGKKVGAIGDAGIFSFHGTKMMTTGEGGMVVTKHEHLFEKISCLNDHGRAKGEKKLFFPHHLGLKYKISNLQAALGLAQTERLPELVARKRAIFFKYKELLNGLDLQMNPDNRFYSSFWLPTVVFPQEVVMQDLLQFMKQRGIDTRTFFYPLSSLPFYSNKPENTVAYQMPQKAINLPSYHDMSVEDIEYVSQVLHEFCQFNLLTTKH
jgi:perosamine synthetase